MMCTRQHRLQEVIHYKSQLTQMCMQDVSNQKLIHHRNPNSNKVDKFLFADEDVQLEKDLRSFKALVENRAEKSLN